MNNMQLPRKVRLDVFAHIQFLHSFCHVQGFSDATNRALTDALIAIEKDCSQPVWQGMPFGAYSPEQYAEFIKRVSPIMPVESNDHPTKLIKEI